jgi:hypothetical protein
MTSIGSSSNSGTIEPVPTEPSLVVGVATYNDEATIAGVVSAARSALTSDVSGRAGRILLVDGGSTDRTSVRAREALGADAAELREMRYDRQPSDLLSVPYHGLPGRARAIRSIVSTARDLGAGACVVLDAGLRGVTADWITTLAKPVLHDGYDYAAPFYDRHPYDGALTKGLVYPLVRALYGFRLRQPAGREFACSAAMLDDYLVEDMWEWDGAQIGIDVWLTTAAVAGGFKVCETPLGLRVHQSRGEVALDLGTRLGQVVGAVFADLENRVDAWQRVRGSKSVPVVGLAQPNVIAPLPIDVSRLIDAFRLGYRELRDIWSTVLPPKTIIELRRAAAAGDEHFRVPDAVWARIVYDFALGYHLRTLPPEHLLGSLTPLYLGWLASFILQAPNASAELADAVIERLALAFEAEKPYLVSRWRWPDRFRT